MDNSSIEFNTDWRKVASSIYRKPRDSKIYGSVEVDVTELENFVAKKRKAGIKTTLTHLMTLIVGRAFSEEVPELNAYIRRGKVVGRKSVDAMVSVLLKGGEMGSVRIPDADRLTVAELTESITKKINESRSGKENSAMQSKHMLSSVPWPFRSWLFNIYKVVTIDWGISFPWVNLSSDSFGSYVISNIGTLGLDSGFGALLPSSNVSIVLIMGKVYKKPVVVNDEIVIRKILNLSATIDHRVVDGSHGGKLFRYIRKLARQPELLDIKPE
ncbi:2-oxoacid dehydrogenases acyltransferase (catalytic domain) [Mariniphaga anaerophila]|uniref:2-oxoacid dehydrogenases acyltransferase (Catalytic domain) n=1 Tax=Mariniphaga anaerophila TaxID=1484053 RepID=A0A1M4VNV6_9BACT|nr:2-oxo acid dehydrogenase subunit E2 [Mariniphaga anaerophila]SHE70530.1 2-oxoacid dehydrogenases acyltransferase (catalytic domain) [Mariniphaga anaerophila]